MKNKQNKRSYILLINKKVTLDLKDNFTTTKFIKSAYQAGFLKKTHPQEKYHLGGPNYEKQTKQAIQRYTIFVYSKLF
jgi:hypothetical protein